MGTVISIILDILAILAIIIFGSFIVVVVADLILCLFDGHQGIIFNKNKKSDDEEDEEEKPVKKDDIVVYSGVNPSDAEEEKKEDKVDGEVVSEIDFDKAIEEQQALNRKKGIVESAPVKPEPKPQPVQPAQEDVFWNIDDDKEFTTLLDEVIKEAKGSDKKEKEVVKEEPKKEDETSKALEELKALKEQQQKEIEEFKQMKEDFAREKEEQLAILKENLSRANEEELEKLKQEILTEQERLEKEQDKLESEKEKLEEQREKLEAQGNNNESSKEEIVKETIIKDEEELNKLKFKNLMRMNNRLSRIIRDTEKLQNQKQKQIEKLESERKKLLEQEQEERLREQEKRIEIQRQNQEILEKQAEAIRRKNEINRKLNEVSRKAGKYKLDNKVVRIPVESSADTHEVVEVVKTVEQTIPGTDTVVKTVEKEPIKSAPTPIFEKAYYEQKLNELDEELREAEKELRINKSEYIPLTRIYKAYDRDSAKLRKKEIQVAKQKVALYGVNSTKVDPAKKAKLDENLQTLAELKDSVEHCEDVIKKNKDRYPVLEKNNKLINKQIDRINDDIKTCEKAIAYYNKKEK